MTIFESGEPGPEGDMRFPDKGYEDNKVEVDDNSELEPGIANPELADFRVELPETATFKDLIDYVKFEFGEDAANKVLAEIQFQTQQEDDFTLEMKILDLKTLYETRGDAQYWLPVIFG